MLKVAHKKRERTRQQASELKEMQKFLLIKVNQTKKHFFLKERKCFNPFSLVNQAMAAPGFNIAGTAAKKEENGNREN